MCTSIYFKLEKNADTDRSLLMFVEYFPFSILFRRKNKFTFIYLFSVANVRLPSTASSYFIN
jgi:hypothetical protein